MSEFKVRAIDFEEKSIVEQEQQLLDEHQKEVDGIKDEPIVEDTPVVENEKPLEIDDNVVLSHIKTRYNKEINSLDDLFQEREANEELPEDVATYLKYKKETGRGIDDFVKLNKDYDKEDPIKLLASYYKETNPEYDQDDIESELEKFSYDSDFDDDKEIKSKERAKKKELAEAKKYFNSLKEQYKVPLESRESLVPEEEKSAYEAFKTNMKDVSSQQEENVKRSKFFAEKTNELFSEKFEGFGFKIDDDNSVSFKPAEANVLKEKQLNISNFIGGFLDDNGYLKDAEAFHRAISVAQDPDKFAKFFYEKGKADGVTNLSKDSKNIDMVRQAPTPATDKSGLQVKVVESGFSDGLKFKKRKN
jgi:NAD-specific glutamate dehydrogenase